MRVLLKDMLDTSQKQLSTWYGQTHLCGTIGKSFKISIGTKDDGLAVFVAVAFETFPNGRAVI